MRCLFKASKTRYYRNIYFLIKFIVKLVASHTSSVALAGIYPIISCCFAVCSQSNLIFWLETLPPTFPHLHTHTHTHTEFFTLNSYFFASQLKCFLFSEVFPIFLLTAPALSFACVTLDTAVWFTPRLLCETFNCTIYLLFCTSSLM